MIMHGSPPHFLSGQIPIKRRGQSEAAGYAEDLSGGIGGFVAGKIDDSLGNLLWQADPAKRNVPHKQRAEIVAQVLSK